MNLRNICCFFIVVLFFYACYDDKGNYEYRDINEITVEGIDASYARDVDDSLRIYPVLKGTMYDDTSRFTYRWEVTGRTLAETYNLEIQIDMVPGERSCRFVVKDKETEVEKYHRFSLNVSSSTAGDLIMVLSKYQGRAELSYLRLDKPSNWAMNYYMDRYGKQLGVEPKQLRIVYSEANRCQPFVNSYGRVMVLADNRVSLLDKSSLMLDTINPYLTGEAYTGLASYPPPDIEGYESQYLMEEGISIWRSNPYGSYFQLSTHFAEISGGTLYTAYSLAPSIWTPGYTYKSKSPHKGSLSAFGFWDAMNPTGDTPTLINMGYDCGDIILFDKTYGRFVYGSAYGGVKEIKKADFKYFEGYNLLWGSATNMADDGCVAVLNNGDNCRLVLFKSGYEEENTKPATKKWVADIAAGDVIKSTTKFYCMKYTNYMFFVTDGNLYLYNLLDIQSGIAPNSRNLVTKLTDMGYDGDAVITDICVSRTEKTLLLGVSRYGNDVEASGEEAKGDLLYFDLNSSTLNVQYNEEKSYKGISGIPVDVEIKYQTHWRDGMFKGELKDNI